MEDPAVAAHEGCVKLQKCLSALTVTFPDRPKLVGFLDILTTGVVGNPDVERAVMGRWHREMTTDAEGRPRQPSLYQQLRDRNIRALLESGSSVLDQLDAAAMFNDPKLSDTSRETLCRALDGVNRKAAAAAGVDIGPPPAATPAADLTACLAACAKEEAAGTAAATAAAAPGVADAASLRASVASSGVRKLRECLHALSVAFPERGKLAAWLAVLDTSVVGTAHAEEALLLKWHTAMTQHADGTTRVPNLYAAVRERRMDAVFASGVWLLDEIDAAAMFCDPGLSEASRERLCKGFETVNSRAAELALLLNHEPLAAAAASTMASLDAAQAVTPETSFAALQAMLATKSGVDGLFASMRSLLNDRELVDSTVRALQPTLAMMATGKSTEEVVAATMAEMTANREIMDRLTENLAAATGRK